MEATTTTTRQQFSTTRIVKFIFVLACFFISLSGRLLFRIETLKFDEYYNMPSYRWWYDASKSNSNNDNNVVLVDDIDETGHDVQRLERPMPLSIVKVPTPIFVLTLPKGGSTTIHQYFQCGLGIGASAHNRYPYAQSNKLKHVGITMRDNIKQNKPLLTVDNDSLDKYQIFSDYDSFKGSLFSMIDSLDNISKFYPNSTILYVRRDPSDWFRSASNFGSLLRRFRSSEKSPLVESLFSPDSPTRPAAMNETHWTTFYENYSDYVRKIGSEHPSLTYLEVPLDSNTDTVMQERIGITKQCWGRANVSSKKNETKNSNDTATKNENDSMKRRRPIALPRNWTADTFS